MLHLQYEVDKFVCVPLAELRTNGDAFNALVLALSYFLETDIEYLVYLNQ